ncbi:MAG: alpha/beta hydrolase [Lachnospiraceae bacterium]|nr:alpha/beta hydrolase [Lachnospiraceae bacterium]
MSENNKVSRRGAIAKELISGFNSNAFFRNNFIEEDRSKSDIDKKFNYPEHFQVERIDLDDFSMELLTWKDSKNDKVVLQLHGGGYVTALRNSYRTMAGLYSEVGKGVSVLTIDYRIAPEHPFPAALDDALCAYRWLLDKGYTEDKIILGGDSAGGGLAMAMCHYFKDNSMKMPLGIVAMSPWTDLTSSGSSYKDNKEKDPIFGHRNDIFENDSPYVADESPSNPYISPLFGDFEGFPPMLIQVGTEEMLLSDSLSVATKAKEAGVKVKLTIYEGMFHVFQLTATILPESKKAWSEVGKFFEVLN